MHPELQHSRRNRIVPFHDQTKSTAKLTVVNTLSYSQGFSRLRPFRADDASCYVSFLKQRPIFFCNTMRYLADIITPPQNLVFQQQLPTMAHAVKFCAHSGTTSMGHLEGKLLENRQSYSKLHQTPQSAFYAICSGVDVSCNSRCLWILFIFLFQLRDENTRSI